MILKDKKMPGDIDGSFIQMSLQARQLQELWTPQDGDIYFDGQGLRPVNIWTDWGCAQRDNRYWLIRPFQMPKEFLKKYIDPSPHKIILLLWGWLAKEVGCPPPFDTMEKIWLAFVMHEMFGMVWSAKMGVWENERF